MRENEITYTPKEIAEVLKVSQATVRRYAKFFGIEAIREDTEKGVGHRRYTKKNQEDLVRINDLIQVQKLTWKIAKEVLDGDKKLVPVQEVPTEEELNYKSLEERINKQEKVIEEMFQQMAAMKESLETERSLRIKTEKNEEKLLLEFEEMKQKIEGQEPKKKSWLSRLLG